MDFTTYLILLFLVLLLLVFLPIISGIGSYKYQKRASFDHKKSDEVNTAYQGYIPPEEAKRLEEEQKERARKKNSRLAKLKNIKVSRGDLPVRFSTGLTNADATLRKRGKKVELSDNDPSNFDFDIDELIEEENASDLRDEQTEARERSAKNQEELETLV